MISISTKTGLLCRRSAREVVGAWVGLPPAIRWWMAGLGALVAATACAVLLLDTSRPLTAAEAAELRAFASATGAPAVIEAYAQATKNGSITQHEAEAVMEVAKAAPPAYPLAEPNDHR